MSKVDNGLGDGENVRDDFFAYRLSAEKTFGDNLFSLDFMVPSYDTSSDDAWNFTPYVAS